MKQYLKFLPFILFSVVYNSYSQCDRIETIEICDMTIIDGNSDGTPDGIINLYQEYTNQIGGTLAPGTWFDPGFNFVLVETTGDVFLWDLNNASEAITDYQFELTNPNCTTGPTITINVVLAAFSGISTPATGADSVNMTSCDVGIDPCGSTATVDLNEIFQPGPNAHNNGVWSYVTTPGNPTASLSDDGTFLVDVDYSPGPPSVDQEIFEFRYTVPNIAGCGLPANAETTAKLAVVRQVFSGHGNIINICETELEPGGAFENIDLRDDAFLVNEDIEGVWLASEDPTGQITGPADSNVSLREVYDDLIATNPRFGSATYDFTYFVDTRPNIMLCPADSSTVSFTFYEKLRPFNQDPAIGSSYCIKDESNPNRVNLYDFLEFTTENGELYDYPEDCCTNWSLVSGPSDLELVTRTTALCSEPIELEELGYSHLGEISLENLTNEAAGTYVFEYVVLPTVNLGGCESTIFGNQTIFDAPDGCTNEMNADGLCDLERALVTIIINPVNYAGENTPANPTQALEFCETSLTSPINLIQWLETDGVFDPVYEGAQGTWTDLDSGDTITNPYTLPEIDGNRTFNFNYSTNTSAGCMDTANLTFTIYEEYSSGTISNTEVCVSGESFNIFDELEGDPSSNGTWTLPDGSTSTNNNVTFEPGSSDAGTYTYTVPANTSTTDPDIVICSGSESTLTINVLQNSNPGEDNEGVACKSDLQFDLLTLLDPSADAGGMFVDINTPATGALSGSLVDLNLLEEGDYMFEYRVQANAFCPEDSATFQLTVSDILQPTVTNETFCLLEAATLGDLNVNGASDFEWYATATDNVPLELSTILVNGEDYFIAATDATATCFSTRASIVANITPLGQGNCNVDIPDGVSPNDDSQNDGLDLSNLPQIYPNFEIKIFNRYGTTVFVGNANTELFRGESNVSLSLGKNLPSGTYFYVFNPRDETTKPFQGNFYLSR